LVQNLYYRQTFIGQLTADKDLRLSLPCKDVAVPVSSVDLRMFQMGTDLFRLKVVI
jgi:hypothetical protein